MQDEIKQAKTKAWWAFARYIRQRDKRCVTCGAPGTQAGHYLPNTDKPNTSLGGNQLWYDERNVHNQCATCNLWKSGNNKKYARFMQEKYGQNIDMLLYTLRNIPHKYTIEDIQEVEQKYLTKFDNLVAGNRNHGSAPKAENI
jgi:hypothetical protein